MAFARLITFDRTLSAAAVAGQAGQRYTEGEVAAREEAAYRRGVDAARAQADQQLVDFRAEVGELVDGVMKKLTGAEAQVVAQLRDALPALAVDLARRLLAGFEPPPEVISRVCEEALGELFPERENLEIVLSTRDAALLVKLNPAWMARYPGLKIRTEDAFTPGDCQVRSRFGLTDARIETKLATLQHALSPA
ncbi:MAG: flagellar biosynthesis protein [Opitutaceae bacterium]|nr:flagellar biosynthesis protein [Opitutaceae bacterium]